MIDLCKKCAWRCKVVLYDGNKIMNSNQCYYRIDACMEIDPHDDDTESCRFFELRNSLKKDNPFKEALEYTKEKRLKNEQREEP